MKRLDVAVDCWLGPTRWRNSFLIILKSEHLTKGLSRSQSSSARPTRQGEQSPLECNARRAPRLSRGSCGRWVDTLFPPIRVFVRSTGWGSSADSAASQRPRARGSATGSNRAAEQQCLGPCGGKGRGLNRTCRPSGDAAPHGPRRSVSSR